MVQTKIPLIVLCLVIVVGSSAINAQDYWEPVTNITGYISTEFNYFDDLHGYDVNYGASVSEAGLLITYRPTEKFTLKSVFVYRPEYTFDQMLNEVFGELTISDLLKFKVGRYLVSLSPINSYYYAPVNTSATLPIIISNHEFFPQNIDGISMNGSVGEDIKFKYDIFAGGYRNTIWLPLGPVGFVGTEVPYFQEQINSLYSFDHAYHGKYNVAVGGSIRASYKTFIEVGAGIFRPKKETIPVKVHIPDDDLFNDFAQTTTVIDNGYERPTYGFNAKVQYNNTRLIGEWWKGNWKNDPILFNYEGDDIPLSTGGDVALEGSFVELSHRLNKFTPYLRYEDQLTIDVEYTRYTIGVNYKPSFTQTVKLEYLLYDHESGQVNGLVGTLIYSF